MNVFKKALLSAAFVGGSLLLTQPAFCYSLDFTMVNDTNQAITAMWTTDVDGNTNPVTNVNVPDGGGSQQITFPGGGYGAGCYYQLDMGFAGGDQSTIGNVDLCTTSKITIDVDSDGNVTYDPVG